MVTRQKKQIASLLLGAALVASGHGARAAEPEAPLPSRAEPEVAPRVHHLPVSALVSGGSLEVAASIEAPDKVKRAVLVYRSGASPTAPLIEVPFLRSSVGQRPYVATIPESAVVAPVLSYAIELETLDGATVAAFASRSSMHAVTVTDDTADARERALLARVGGRRTVLAASGDFVHFGTTPATLTSPGVAPTVTSVRDQYWRVEGQFTYRLFRTVAEFGLRAGMVRGSSPVPGAADASKFDVGLNYGAPRIRLRATDWLHLDGEFLTSVTEIGYSVGGGGAVILGDPLGTRLTLGGEGVEVFGARGYTRLDVAIKPWIVAGTVVEVTDMPHAEKAGVRLTADVRVDLGGGIGVGVRGGYQARSFASGGPNAGLTVAYAF